MPGIEESGSKMTFFHLCWLSHSDREGTALVPAPGDQYPVGSSCFIQQVKNPWPQAVLFVELIVLSQ